jgi:hypothetical protein
MEAHQVEPAPKSPRERTNLDQKYGRIGISAVVAALRYQEQTAKRSRSQGPDRLVPGAGDEAA